MNEEVEHVVALPADLQPHLHPVQAGGLEELGGLEGPEQVPLPLGLGRAVVEGVEDVVLEQLLVADSHFDGLACGAVLPVPRLDQGHVKGAPAPARPEVEGPRGPQEGDPVGRIVTVQRAVLQVEQLRTLNTSS